MYKVHQVSEKVSRERTQRVTDEVGPKLKRRGTGRSPGSGTKNSKRRRSKIELRLKATPETTTRGNYNG